MKVLIIDNKDSFTYNIKHYVEQFTSFVHVVSVDKLELNSIEFYDKFIISPGPGLPSDYPILKSFLNKFHHYKPILGICLGHQLIAEFFGAKLYNLPKVKHGVKSKIYHNNKSNLFKNLPNSFMVGHYHSWAVSEHSISDDLILTSRNDEDLVMSLKHKYYNIETIQFHPESILTDYGINIIENWLID